MRWLLPVFFKKKSVFKHFRGIEVIHAIGGGSVDASYIISKVIKKPYICQYIGSDVNVHLKNYLKSSGFHKAVISSSYNCFNSKELEIAFTKLIKVNRKEVIYRGVKLEEFPFYFELHNKINFLFLGGFPGDANLKGGFTLLEALKLLVQKSFPLSVQFIIGGPNSKKYKKHLPGIKHEKISIEFIGAVNSEMVKKLMRESHVIIIPSLQEGVPNVLFEAMSSGNMILASNVGGIPELIDDGKNGRLFPAGDSLSLFQITSEIIQNSEMIETFAFQARKKIENYNYSNFVKKYECLYKKLNEKAG